jgi:hypothetical protein
MKIYELILEDDKLMGVDAISIVESPAIEEQFIALSKQQIQFKVQNEEKQVLIGAALIPEKPIYRYDDKTGEEYYVYFSAGTIRKAAELFLIKGNQNNATLEHSEDLNGLSIVESWIVEDKDHDKSRAYGLEYPIGTWVVMMKVNNKAIWDEYVKEGKVKGFSIEGWFAQRESVNLESIQTELASIEMAEAEHLVEQYIFGSIRALIVKDGRRKDGKRLVMESYSDYPDSVSNNAKRGIELNEKNNNKCATQVGKVRAQQLADGKPVSVETIKRMHSYLSRAEEYYDESDTQACGTISYLLWGGLSAKRWAESKLKELGQL